MDIEAMQRQADELNATIKAEKDRVRKAEREERRAKEHAEREAHYAQMFEEIGRGVAGLNEAQHAIVYAAAWEQGRHSSGYSEVEMHYREFAEMARQILDASTPPVLR